jgi:hypothetical protein
MKQYKSKKKEQFAKSEDQFQEIVLVLRCYFHLSCSLLQPASRSQFICLHKVKSFHVATFKTLNIESNHLSLSLCDSQHKSQ